MSALAWRPTRRNRSQTCGRTIKLALPVSDRKSIDDQMNHAFLLLQETGGDECPGLAADAPEPLPDLRPDDQIGTAGFRSEVDRRSDESRLPAFARDRWR